MKTYKIHTLILCALILSACGQIAQTPKTDINLNLPTSISNPTTSPPASPSSQPKYSNLVGLKTKDGQIVIKLYDKEAPKTVKNFLNKVNSGFYNNLTFHRVVSNFVVQGGDPTGTGSGGGTIASELNNIPFKRGSLGLARTAQSKDISNDSQFYICLTDIECSHLTSEYVNFGEVVSGLDVLDKIRQGDLILEMTTTTK